LNTSLKQSVYFVGGGHIKGTETKIKELNTIKEKTWMKTDKVAIAQKLNQWKYKLYTVMEGSR
jgi:hypothetical protein